MLTVYTFGEKTTIHLPSVSNFIYVQVLPAQNNRPEEAVQKIADTNVKKTKQYNVQVQLQLKWCHTAHETCYCYIIL